MPDVYLSDLFEWIRALAASWGVKPVVIVGALFLGLIVMVPSRRRRRWRPGRAGHVGQPSRPAPRAANGVLRGRWRAFRLVQQVRHGRSIERMAWDDFERLVAGAFRRWGYTVSHQGLGGADGGVDLVATKNGRRTIIQCKRWQSAKVGAPEVREMFGLMLHFKADAIAVVTSGSFTRPVYDFARDKPIELIDGAKLRRLLSE